MPELNHFSKYGAEYFQLYISCPICLRDLRPTSPTFWTHSLDDGDMFIGDDGYYVCKTCGHRKPIIDWAYQCEDCEGAGLGKSVKLDNLKHIAEAISISGQITNVSGVIWLNKLTASIMAQCGIVPPTPTR